MSQLSTPTPRYSKRKRTQVDYYESESEIEDVNSELDSQDVVEYSQAKVCPHGFTEAPLSDKHTEAQTQGPTTAPKAQDLPISQAPC
jgi:hypothetical protein